MRAAIFSIGSTARMRFPVNAKSSVNFPVPAPRSMMVSAGGRSASKASGYSGRPATYSLTLPE